jgi:hypothetical protein
MVLADALCGGRHQHLYVLPPDDGRHRDLDVLPSGDTSPRSPPDDLVPRIDHNGCAVFVDTLLAGWAILAALFSSTRSWMVGLFSYLGL